jgi:hypothetical protein
MAERLERQNLLPLKRRLFKTTFPYRGSIGKAFQHRKRGGIGPLLAQKPSNSMLKTETNIFEAY